MVSVTKFMHVGRHYFHFLFLFFVVVVDLGVLFSYVWSYAAWSSWSKL